MLAEMPFTSSLCLCLNLSSQPPFPDFWDTAGQERFASMHPSYYYRAQVCILVFDVTRKSTYQHLLRWYQELRSYSEAVPCIVVANKIDVDYRVTKKSFRFPKDRNLPFHFVSAADGTNVVSVFREAIEAAHKFKHKSKDFMAEVMQLLDDDTLGTAAGGTEAAAAAAVVDAAAAAGTGTGEGGVVAGSGTGGTG
jgi:hypothetical protein